MYTKEHFSLPSLAAMCDFARERSFGVLSTCHEGELYTSPLPFDLRVTGDDELFVAGHIARGNDMTRSFVPGVPATITVLGADSYAAAEWFGTRSRIPTWLYCAVEISGRLEPSDPARTREDVLVFMARLQAQHVEASTWTLNEIRSDLAEGYLKGIIGYRLLNPTIKSCFRLNQRKGEGPSLAGSLCTSDVPARRQLGSLVLDPPTIISK